MTLHGGGLPHPLKGRVRVARTLLAGLRTATTRLGGVSLREGQQARQHEHDPQRVGTGTGASSTVAGQPGS